MVKKNPRNAGARLRRDWESGDPLGSPPERPEVLAERRRRPRPALGHGLASGEVREFCEEFEDQHDDH